MPSNSRSPLALAAAVGLALVCSSSFASAYCRTTTCDPNKEDCKFNAHGCATAGNMLWWTNLCVGYALQEKGSPHIAYTDVVSTVSNAFRTWELDPPNKIACSDGTRPTIQIHDMGPVPCDAVEYNQRAGNANIVIFRSGKWPHVDKYGHSTGASTIALTTVTFNSETGEIYDADIEVNDGPELAAGKITVGDTEIGYDLQSVITHEAGHFYGLAHSPVSDATMKATYETTSVMMRSLAEDDIAGICDMYGATRPYKACDPTPRRGFQSTCGQPDAETKKACCTSSTAPGHSTPSGASSLALVALGIAAMRLRRSSNKA